MSKFRTVDSVLSIDVILEICFTWEGSGGGKGPAARLAWAKFHTIYPLSEMRGALFDTIEGIFFANGGVANTTPQIREVGFQVEDLSLSVSLSCFLADVRETTASLFAKTPDVRHQAIASPDAGQRERSKWNMRP
jgi:hypothetical protein